MSAMQVAPRELVPCAWPWPRSTGPHGRSRRLRWWKNSADELGVMKMTDLWGRGRTCFIHWSVFISKTTPVPIASDTVLMAIVPPPLFLRTEMIACQLFHFSWQLQRLHIWKVDLDCLDLPNYLEKNWERNFHVRNHFIGLAGGWEQTSRGLVDGGWWKRRLIYP